MTHNGEAWMGWNSMNLSPEPQPIEKQKMKITTKS
jgi:hypothetical protein